MAISICEKRLYESLGNGFTFGGSLFEEVPAFVMGYINDYLPQVANASLSNMFSYCVKLTHVPDIHTISMQLNGTFWNCRSLETVGLLDIREATNLSGILGNQYNPLPILRSVNLLNCGTSISGDYNFSGLPLWERDSVMSCLYENSFDRTGLIGYTFNLHKDAYNRLTQNDLDSIKSKNYMITST